MALRGVLLSERSRSEHSVVQIQITMNILSSSEVFCVQHYWLLSVIKIRCSSFYWLEVTCLWPHVCVMLAPLGPAWKPQKEGCAVCQSDRAPSRADVAASILFDMQLEGKNGSPSTFPLLFLAYSNLTGVQILVILRGVCFYYFLNSSQRKNFGFGLICRPTLLSAQYQETGNVRG